MFLSWWFGKFRLLGVGTTRGRYFYGCCCCCYTYYASLVSFLLLLCGVIRSADCASFTVATTTTTTTTTGVFVSSFQRKPASTALSRHRHNNKNDVNTNGAGGGGGGGLYRIPTTATTERIMMSAQDNERPTPSADTTTTRTGDDKDSSSSSSIDNCWLHEGLLFSSFSDGLQGGINEHVQRVLRRGLIRAMLKQQQQNLEQMLKASVVASPCNGPNMDYMQQLEYVDEILKRYEENEEEDEEEDSERLLLGSDLSLLESQLRVVYIPTAMYALRPDSNNTPGKQRQRNRADAKKRRDEIIRLLQSLQLPPELCSIIATVTLDLSDGSIKQPQLVSSDPDSATATTTTAYFPQTGREALQRWQPHLVYIQGGNTFWLYHCCCCGNDEHDWSSDLLQLLVQQETTLFCGASAGAILAGASMETATWKGWDDPRVVPGRGTYDDWKQVDGLRWLGKYAIFPHYDATEWQNLVQDRGEDLRKRTGIVTCCLEEDQVYHVYQQQMTLL